MNSASKRSKQDPPDRLVHTIVIESAKWDLKSSGEPLRLHVNNGFVLFWIKIPLSLHIFPCINKVFLVYHRAMDFGTMAAASRLMMQRQSKLSEEIR